MAGETTTADRRGAALQGALVRRLTEPVVSGGTTTLTYAPFTGAPLAELPTSTAADVTTAYERAATARDAWAARDPRARAVPFLRFHDLVLDRQREVLDIIQWETGKARKHAFEEVIDAAAGTLYHARTAPGLLRPHRRGGALPVATRTVELRQPKGTVAVITPWNYPLSLTMADVAPALLAGNAVVHKPDTQTALTALWARDLLVEAGLPPEMWQVVLGEPDTVGGALVDGADYVAFTGSTRAGRAIAERAAARLVGCSLELGGKNPMLVLADADLGRAAEGAVRACFSNAGQLCISMERLYVHASVSDAFTERLLRRVEDMRLGAGLDFTADMGSLTHGRQLDTTTRHVEEARAAGARVLTGGRPRPDIGPLFYEPTVLAGVTPEMAVCTDETFGPVVSLYPVDHEDEAVELANATEYGLNASVWTRDATRGRAVAARLQAGTVNINEGYAAAFGSYAAPMGGMKNSGLGRRHGPEGLLRFTEAQTVASQHVVGFEPPSGMPVETWTKLMTRSLKLLKRLGVR